MGVVWQVKLVLADTPVELGRVRALVADLIDGGFVAGPASAELGLVTSPVFAYAPMERPLEGNRGLYAGAEREPLLDAITHAGEGDLLVRFFHLNEGALVPEEYLAELDAEDEDLLDDLQLEQRARARIRMDEWLGERFVALVAARAPKMLRLIDGYAEEDDEPRPPIGPACVWIELEGKHVPMDDIEGTRLTTLLAKHGLGPLAIGTGAW